MNLFLGLALGGAASGAIYSVMAAGLVLSYSTSGVFNFAHGSVAFATAFVFYELNTGLGWNAWLAAAVAVLIFAPLLGIAVDRVVFSKLQNATETSKVMATVGLMIAIPAAALGVVQILINDLGRDIPNGSNILFPPGVGWNPEKTWLLARTIDFSSSQAVMLITIVIIGVGLWLLVGHTRLGLRLRATVDRPGLAQWRGIDIRRASRMSWALGFAIAGVAGVVGSPLLSLAPATFTGILFVAATAAALGRMRSIPIAMLGGLFIGVAENLVTGYVAVKTGIADISAAVPFVLLLGALLILGKSRARQGGVSANDAPPRDYLSDLPAWRRGLPWAIVGVGLMVYDLFFANAYWQSLIPEGLALGLVFLSFVVVTGIGGMVSLAQAAFVTLAALVAGLLLAHGVPFLPALIIGAMSAGAAGVIVALPAIRLGGLSLALATLALALLGDNVLFGWNSFNNGGAGWNIPHPEIGPLNFAGERSFAILLAVIIGIAIVLVRNLQRSATGRAIRAIRSTEIAAASSGVAPVGKKIAVFGLSATIAGVGGVMLASSDQHITNVNFTTTTGLVWLAAVVIFGVRRPGGAVAAGVMYVLFPALINSVISSQLFDQFLFGLGAIALANNADGAMAHIGEIRQRQRLRRKQRSVDALASRQDSEESEPGDGIRGPVRGGPPAVPIQERSSNDVGGEPALIVQGLCAGYGTAEVLHGVDLQIWPGSLTLVLGPNGAGKSTLCSVISGALSATKGEIILHGEDVTRLRSDQIVGKGIVLAPESRGIFPNLTVDENLAVWLNAKHDRTTVYDGFPLLNARRSSMAGNLSGGEQQILTLAPLLVHPPKVLVVDELTLGLAPLLIPILLGLMQQFREEGCAILLAGEQGRVSMAIADMVGFLSVGQMLWMGPPDEVDEAQISAAYLGKEGLSPLEST